MSTPTLAQLVGEKAEMERLETKAEEAMANGDPNGAALSIGKAAMMAAILSRQKSEDHLKSAYMGTEALFRTQENGYRAMALFEQAGGNAPAPKGACQLLSLAHQYSTTAHKIFSNIDVDIPSESTLLAQRYSPQSREWIAIIQELKTDFACS